MRPEVIVKAGLLPEQLGSVTLTSSPEARGSGRHRPSSGHEAGNLSSATSRSALWTYHSEPVLNQFLDLQEEIQARTCVASLDLSVVRLRRTESPSCIWAVWSSGRC